MEPRESKWTTLKLLLGFTICYASNYVIDEDVENKTGELDISNEFEPHVDIHCLESHHIDSAVYHPQVDDSSLKMERCLNLDEFEHKRYLFFKKPTRRLRKQKRPQFLQQTVSSECRKSEQEYLKKQTLKKDYKCSENIRNNTPEENFYKEELSKTKDISPEETSKDLSGAEQNKKFSCNRFYTQFYNLDDNGTGHINSKNNCNKIQQDYEGHIDCHSENSRHETSAHTTKSQANLYTSNDSEHSMFGDMTSRSLFSHKIKSSSELNKLCYLEKKVFPKNIENLHAPQKIKTSTNGETEMNIRLEIPADKITKLQEIKKLDQQEERVLKKN